MVVNYFQTYIDLGLLPIQLASWNEAHLIQVFDWKDRDVGLIAAEYKRDIFQLKVVAP